MKCDVIFGCQELLKYQYRIIKIVFSLFVSIQKLQMLEVQGGGIFNPFQNTWSLEWFYLSWNRHESNRKKHKVFPVVAFINLYAKSLWFWSVTTGFNFILPINDSQQSTQTSVCIWLCKMSVEHSFEASRKAW